MKRLVSFCFMALLVFLLLGEVTSATAGKPSGSMAVSPYFTSHMVLQRDAIVPVFGTATAGTPVAVTFTVGSQTVSASAQADTSGKWRVNLPSMPANDLGGTLLVSGGGKTYSFSDVLVGEVWVLSGQSNINLPLWQCIGGTEAAAKAGDYPNIRLYMSNLSSVGTTGTWLMSIPANSRYWSGVGFFFARALQQQMPDPVPVGLIQVAKNGSSIADWTTFNGNRGRFYVDNIIPIQPMAIRGVIWYQGETEADPSAYYRMLPGLIGNWRADWKQGNFPFYIVQLAQISGRDSYAVIRDAQVSTIDEANNIEMACIIDIDTVPTTEIHPPDKEPVGDRLALIARANLYGETVFVFSGPIRDLSPSVTRISGSSIVVGFKHAEGGLVTEDGAIPGPFMIAGANGVYYSATAHLAGPDTIEVFSPSVPYPKSVRYGWAAYPQCNLLNGARQPASPFGLTFP